MPFTGGCGTIDRWASAQCRSQRMVYLGKIQRHGRRGDQCGYAVWTVACGL
jgi:hypothetical protein